MMSRSWMVVLLLAAVAGCTPSPFDADVSGRITLDGQPVEPGVVIFSYVEGGRDSSRGRIDPGGTYHLVTRHSRGIDPGKYRVAVRVFEKGEPPAPGERAAADLPPLVPERYLDVKTSGISYEVVPGNNTIDIELTSSGGGA